MIDSRIPEKKKISNYWDRDVVDGGPETLRIEECSNRKMGQGKIYLQEIKISGSHF